MVMLARGLILTLGLIFLWQLLVWIFQLPPYLLPSPYAVIHAWIVHSKLIVNQTAITLLEALLGLILGSLLGIIGALAMMLSRSLRFWMLPILVISQAVPIFAIAPVLVLWLGYGITSKIAVTVLMLFFPVISAFHDGLQRTDPAWLDMASIMGANRLRRLWLIQVPAALPALVSGLRLATVFAPIGAVVGEWVGASKGLGFLMLSANAQLQIDLMFACLITIIAMALFLYFAVNFLLRPLLRFAGK